jgi:predicted Zn-dependent protease
LWGLACDASLAESDATPGNAGVTAALTAEGAARRALALVPLRANNVERLANALGTRALRAGSAALADSAEALHARVTEMAPADAWLLVSRIRFELARRDGERALASARRLEALYPEAALGHSLAGGALLLLGRADEARDELLRARAARWEEDAGEQRAALERLLQQLSPGEMEPAPRP